MQLLDDFGVTFLICCLILAPLSCLKLNLMFRNSLCINIGELLFADQCHPAVFLCHSCLTCNLKTVSCMRRFSIELTMYIYLALKVSYLVAASIWI